VLAIGSNSGLLTGRVWMWEWNETVLRRHVRNVVLRQTAIYFKFLILPTCPQF